MKIVILSSEATPFAKTGGLADVAGALPKFLTKLGLEASLIMPLYREVRKKNLPLRRVIENHPMDWDGTTRRFSVWQASLDGASALFIEQNEWFDRDFLYGTPAGDYPDNGQRFSFYSKATMETLKVMDVAPDILHAHDWQSAMALAYLKFSQAEHPLFKRTRSLFTIHNLAYQGIFDRTILGRIGLPDSLFTMDNLEFYGQVNFLKAGILYATAVNTVSPRYSREIQTPEFGHGLDGLLQKRKEVLFGILNGVDYTAWDPARDSFLASPYTASRLEGKAACKQDLLETFGLPLSRKEAPVIGMVSRLAGQKGLDLLVEALGGLFRLGATLVILGTGEEKIQKALSEARKRYPSYFGLKIAFDDCVAHKIMAGSDMLLIPSRYEPCGLTQMYSLKYGTIPVVRATGGLDDSVQEFRPESQEGNGFKFDAYSAPALLEAASQAIKVYGHKSSWNALIQNAMALDFSWDRASAEYLSLYRKISSFQLRVS